ncbi:MAG: hypothetical protein IJL78_01080 [Lachnospiraceae bacterium]|nr:hypothetical protein [Lachnospiraceae bacterium]MBQ7601279.1 hypothetical protein [Lachnospiraceae bacterium]
MALVTLNFESQYLMNNHNVGVILPDRPHDVSAKEFYESGKKYKVLWLLHGTFGDYSDWIRKSMIELYASEKNLIVVMPSAMNSNYANWPSFGTGFDMFDYLTEELMPLIYNWFPASDKRKDNFIAGLSMGGRGTCVYAFNHPEKFAGAAILSANPSDFNKMRDSGAPMWERMKKSAINFEGGEEEFVNSYQNTVKVLREQAAKGVKLPKLFIGAGEEDKRIMDDLPETLALFKELGIKNVKVYTVPGLAHEWRYWDLAIQEALDFFGL